MTAPLFLRSDAVAQLLGLGGADAFLTRRDWMERAQLFPRPMPHSLRPLLWKRDEVLAWLDRFGRPVGADVDPTLIATGKVHLIEMARSA